MAPLAAICKIYFRRYNVLDESRCIAVGRIVRLHDSIDKVWTLYFEPVGCWTRTFHAHATLLLRAGFVPFARPIAMMTIIITQHVGAKQALTACAPMLR